MRSGYEEVPCKVCLAPFSRDKRTVKEFCSFKCKLFAWINVSGSDDCWNWTGKTNKGGYGLLHGSVKTETPKERLVHRHAWILKHGPIPAGLYILHSCDNRLCCNVNHMALGTKADNNADMYAKKRDCFSKGTIAWRPGGKGWCNPSQL
jgi:hypothetical protein